MKIKDDEIILLKNYIENSFTQNFSNSFLQNQADLICKLMNSHYFATILFPNRHSEQLYYFSNNPEEFNKVYLPLQNKDILQDMMISNNVPVTYSNVKGLDISEKDDFFAPLQKIRPVTDCMYIPFVLNNRLCGFTALAREGGQIYEAEDLCTLNFLSAYIKETFIRSFDFSSPEENQALLDKKGNVLSCGSIIKDAFTILFGEKYWEKPIYSDKKDAQDFKKTINTVLHNNIDSPGTLELEHEEGKYRLEFKKIHRELDFSSIPASIPVFEIRLKKKTDRNISLVDYDKFVDKYGLTAREKEVVDCIYQGLDNKTISEQLTISLSTVKKHIWNVYNKVGVDNRTGLIFALSQ